jgi:D-tagatose-1,6-bisphosphate aldolase subunit GatZ/KbaZ
MSSGWHGVFDNKEARTVRSPLLDTIERHKLGEPVGVTSVCSAHPLVLEAAVLQARDTGGYVLVEATSNQVDQTGGYTGMRPSDFRELVHGIAARCGLPLDRVVLGGDHLGPNRWRSLPAEQAMQHAEVLVEAYAAAGFTKLHLDCTFSCADDPTPIRDDLAADRAARLIRVAEETINSQGVVSELRYVIGTEVPVPGGAHETLGELQPTTRDAARATLQRQHQAVAAQGLDDVWPRVMALVVQPGVEFDHLRVVDYQRERTWELRQVLDDEPHMVFEAHSTDYQTIGALTALVEDHWAVLKVGPGLTFALREALFALAAIEAELVAPADQSHLPEVVERRMLEAPSQWEGYYPGSSDQQRLARRYSYSDRLRYYWPDQEVHSAQERLLTNLEAVDLPLPLISAYLPEQYARIRRGELAAQPHELVIDHVRDVLRAYTRACDPTS